MEKHDSWHAKFLLSSLINDASAQVEATRETDESGWGYATHWNKSWQDHSSKTTLVRRRKWFRVRKASLSPTVALNEDKATPEEGVPLNVGPPS